MRNKNITGFLALILGIFGIHRFYLGQYLLGAFYILFPPVAAMLLTLTTGTQEMLQHYSTDFNIANLSIINNIFFAPIYFYLPVLLVAIIDAIAFFVRSRAWFDRKYNSPPADPGRTILFSVLAIILSGIILYSIYSSYFATQTVDVSGADADMETSATGLADIFSNNEAAFDEYGNKVVLIMGIVVDEEYFIATGMRSLILLGTEDMNIKCSFKEGQQDQVEQVKLGNEITVKGVLSDVVNDILLQECLLIDIRPGIPAEVGITDTFRVEGDTMTMDKDNLKVDVDTLPADALPAP